MTHFSAATVRSVRRAHSVTHKALQRCKLVSSQSVARTFSTGTAAVYTPGDAEEYETKVADSAHLNLEDRSCFQLTKETINENILKAEYVSTLITGLKHVVNIDQMCRLFVVQF